jgi:hypothetical protein
MTLSGFGVYCDMPVMCQVPRRRSTKTSARLPHRQRRNVGRNACKCDPICPRQPYTLQQSTALVNATLLDELDSCLNICAGDCGRVAVDRWPRAST